ncbi:DUF6653 family protein [Roseibium sp. SCP14]|uniref:DUF6653 family protein n=1 Tax=Roseibium sp. SCP14 TaxID=3141375 RepID=UPI003338A5B9
MQITQRHHLPKAHVTQNDASGVNTPLLLLKSRAAGPVGSVSTYAKIFAPALLSAAIWAKLVVGGVFSMILLASVLLFLFKLPSIFSGRNQKDNWAQRASFGERIWLNRILIPIPADVNQRITILYLVFWTGTLIAILGAVSSSLLLSATGLLVAYAAQGVCLGKLIGLYNEMKEKTPLYRFWAVRPVNDNKSVRTRKA